MIFDLSVKTMDEHVVRGDLVYNARKLFRVERVGKPQGSRRIVRVKFRVIGKVNLDREMRKDRAY